MQILPAEIQPPATPLPQTHGPRATKTFGKFKQCLRWEAGFVCEYCLVHECDYQVRGGVDGQRLYWIEHAVTQAYAEKTGNPELIYDYTNLRYACAHCNHARRDADGGGTKLLDPRRDAWGAHFVLKNSRLEVKSKNDRRARFTQLTYQINRGKKRGFREQRRQRIAEALECFSSISAVIEKLVAESFRIHEFDPSRARTLMSKAIGLRRARRQQSSILLSYRAIPEDAGKSCRCDPETMNLSLPSFLDQQCESLQACLATP